MVVSSAQMVVREAGRSMRPAGDVTATADECGTTEEFAHLIDIMPAAVVVVGGEGRIIRANAAARTWLGEDVNGRTWREVIARHLTPHAGDDVVLEDGRILNLSTCPLGVRPGQVVVMQDVTENRRLHQRLGHYQRLSAMGEMAARLAHQIRTPLASVMLHLSNLSKVQSYGDVSRVADKCLERLHHLNRVVEDMLLFARGGTQETENLEVSELFRRVAEQNQTMAGQTAIQLQDDSHGAMVRGNRTMLVSMLQNLIDNAIQACGDGAQIELSARRMPRQRIQLAISDNGPGVPEDLRARIFEPFFTTRAQGTGLGLAVVHAVTRDHHAEIDLDSEPGCGAKFTITFPAVAPAAARTPMNNDTVARTTDSTDLRGEAQ